MSADCFDAHNQDFYAGNVDTATTWSPADDTFLPSVINKGVDIDATDGDTNPDYVAQAPLCTWNVRLLVSVFRDVTLNHSDLLRYRSGTVRRQHGTATVAETASCLKMTTRANGRIVSSLRPGNAHC